MKITREGLRLILATLLVGLASLNTGNNLMYLILSVMLAVLFLSFIVTYINLRGIEVKVEQLGELYAGRPSKIKITLSNRKRFLSSHSLFLKIEDPVIISTYIRKLGPKEEKEVFEEVLPLRRGLFDLNKRVLLRTGFPFIFTEKTIMPELQAKLLIYPSLIDIEEELFSFEETGKGILNEEEFYKIREYRYGDDRRWIHWKATAKRGELMTKEYGTQETRKITIIFDNFRQGSEVRGQKSESMKKFMPQNLTSDIPYLTSDFERSVSFAASLAVKLIEMGMALRFVTCKKTIPFGIGKETLLKILDLLAVINLSDDFFCLIEEKDLEDPFVVILQSDSSPLSRFKDRAIKTYYAREI